MEQMDLINDEQLDLLSKGLLASFPGDNVPLFRRGHDDLSLLDLLFAHLAVAGEFPHNNIERSQSF